MPDFTGYTALTLQPADSKLNDFYLLRAAHCPRNGLSRGYNAGRERIPPSSYYLETPMTQATDRRANRAGLFIEKRTRGTVYIDPVTGQSIYDGNRSRKSFHKVREIEAFLRRRERGGMD